jgi:glycosyltransferase involved in cell wall biosynthesis
MRILLIHDFYQHFGGEDAAAMADKALLESNNQEVLLYTRDNSEIRDFSLIEKLTFPIQTLYSWQTKIKLTQLVRDRLPDVAYVHNFFPLISPSVYHVLHSLHVPIIQVIHDFRFFCPNGWFFTQGQVCERCKGGNYLNAVRFRCYRDSYLSSALAASSIGTNRLGGMLEKIDAFICLTNFLKQKLVEAGIRQEKIFVKPNFIDASQITPAYGQGEYALYLGRLSREKGIWTLLRAFQQLKGISLKIAGSGPMEAELRRFLKENAVKNVEIVGFKSGKDKRQLLAESMFVVMPSEWYETFGLVILEAYAAGKPVVASSIGSLPYVVRDGKSGLLFAAGDIHDLAEKIERLSTHPDEREAMGRFGRTLVETEYGPRKNYELLMELFGRIARSRDASCANIC